MSMDWPVTRGVGERSMMVMERVWVCASGVRRSQCVKTGPAIPAPEIRIRRGGRARGGDWKDMVGVRWMIGIEAVANLILLKYLTAQLILEH